MRHVLGGRCVNCGSSATDEDSEVCVGCEQVASSDATTTTPERRGALVERDRIFAIIRDSWAQTYGITPRAVETLIRIVMEGVEQAVCEGDAETGRWYNSDGVCECPACRDLRRPVNPKTP